MAIPPVSGTGPPVAPTPTPNQTPQLSAAQQGDVAGGRAAVVEGQVVPIHRAGVEATAATAHTWGSAPAGSAERNAFDQAAQRLGTTDPVRVASDIGRQLGLGGSGSAPANAVSPAAPSAPSAPSAPAVPSASAVSAASPAPVSAAAASTANPVASTLSGLLGGARGAVGSTVQNLLPGGLGVATTSQAAAGLQAGTLPSSPLGALVGRGVAATPLQPIQSEASVLAGARPAGGGPAGQARLSAPLAQATAATNTLGRDVAPGAVLLGRGERGVAGVPLDGDGRPTGATTLGLAGVPREALAAALGTMAAVPGERGVPGAIAPSAGRALAQEALLARMASMFAPAGQGARGGEPGSWMGLAAALAGRNAAGEAANAGRLPGEAHGDTARLTPEQPTNVPIFGANPPLRADEHLDDAAAGLSGGEDVPFACRIDSRPPEIIFASGFDAAPAAIDVVAQAGDAIVSLAAPLANAAALDIARLRQRETTTLRRIGGVEVDRALGDDGFAHEIADIGKAAAPQTVRAMNLGERT